MRSAPWLTLLALACVNDNEIAGAKPGDAEFDTSSNWEPPGTDTGDFTPTDEECNGVDDDGDGEIDEGFPDQDNNGRVDCLDSECPVLDLGTSGAVTIPDDCAGSGGGGGAEVTDDPWDAKVKWTWGAGRSVWMTPVIGNLDDDNGDGSIDENDSPDVVVSVSDNTIVAIDGATGSTKWTYSGGNGYGGTSIADVDGDGQPEVVAANSARQTIVLSADGSLEWTATDMLASLNYVLHNVADVDNDGRPEIIYDSHVMNGEDGTTDFTMAVGSSGGSWAYRLPAVGDVDLDGDQEIANEGCLYDSDGSELWCTGEIGTYGFWPILIQADSDAEAEVGFVGAQWTLWDHDGSNIYRKSYTSGQAQPGPPCAGDFDGDGTAEVAWPSYQTFVAYELDGTQMWSVPMDDTSGLSGCSAYDLNNDGALEILFADQSTFTIFDGSTGRELFVDTHSSPTIFEYPTVADLDADDHAEIVVAHYGSATALTAYEHGGSGWPAAGSTWNVHDFAITNVNPDGSIPTNPDPSWLKYNVYRARVAADDPSTADLYPAITDVCVADCDYGPVVVAVQVVNQGGADSNGSEVLVLYSDMDTGLREVARQTIGVVPAGTKDYALEFELLPGDIGEFGWRAEIESPSVSECDEDNNYDTWVDTVCP